MSSNLHHETIDRWINTLRDCDFEVLLTKPAPDCWSLGQVFMHILEDTNYYLDQAEYCLTHSENQSRKMSGFAIALFLNNEFPDQKIKGDPSASQNIPQPKSTRDLYERMAYLKIRLNSLWAQVAISNSNGKTKHPGLGYFNAQEWLKFSDIHMRHHFRQKKRIEAALEKGSQHES